MITPGVTMVTAASPANVFANDKGVGGTGEDLREQLAKLWENIGCLGWLWMHIYIYIPSGYVKIAIENGHL